MLRRLSPKSHENSLENSHNINGPDDRMHLLSEPVSRELRERQASFLQPILEEKRIVVRRISVGPGAPDIMTRVNSISSTLNFSDDPNPDLLPNQERKNSVLSVSSSIPKQNMRHDVVDMGERRPSVLSLDGGQSLQLRKVSVGGGEDILRIRGASVSSWLDRSLTPPMPETARLAPEEFIGHPSNRRCNQAATHKKIVARPDSNALTHAHSLKTDRDLENDPSVIEVRSPKTADSVGGVFEGWSGFPVKGILTSGRRMSPLPPEGDGGDDEMMDHAGMTKAKRAEAGVGCDEQAKEGFEGPPVIPLPFALQADRSGNLGWAW